MTPYEIVTERIIAQLEKGVVPWYRPWEYGCAVKRSNGERYNFLNQVLLGKGSEWGTYSEWVKQNCYIKKNEKASIIIGWFNPKRTVKVETEDGEEEKVLTGSVRPKIYYVFSRSQVIDKETGEIPKAKYEPKTYTHKSNDSINKIVSDYEKREKGLRIKIRQSPEAFYSPLRDIVVCPELSQFKERNEFYSTLFHELIHSTGHNSRLDRFDKEAEPTMFGSDSYSKEELIAEMGVAMLCYMTGIETEKSFNNSASYLKGWLDALKGDKKLIVCAASQAEKAVNRIMNVKTEKAKGA